jgi:hypothetical protein
MTKNCENFEAEVFSIIYYFVLLKEKTAFKFTKKLVFKWQKFKTNIRETKNAVSCKD